MTLTVPPPAARPDPALPLPLSAADLALVDGAVAWLNRSVQTSSVQLAVEVSDYIVATFFGGDFQAFADPSRTKPVSFRALARRDDLAIGEATLYRLVRIGQQVGQLPADIAEALTLKHHRALLSLSDGRSRHALARQAAAEGWTAQQLADAIQQKQPLAGNKRGRKPVPAELKGLAAMRRATQQGPDPAGFAAVFAGLAPQQQAATRADVLALAERVKGLVAAVSA